MISYEDTDEDEKLEVELQKEEHRHYVERVGDEIYETSVDKDLLEDGVNLLAKKVKFG